MNDIIHPQPSSTSSLVSSWQDQRYRRFYEVVNTVVEDILCLPSDDGVVKKRLKGERLDRLRYSVGILIRDTVAIVMQRGRAGDASIHLGRHAYGSDRDDKLLTHDIHVKRAYEGMVRLGYIEVTHKGFYDRIGRNNGKPTSKLTRYRATATLINLFTIDEQLVLPVIVPPTAVPQVRVTVKQMIGGVERKRSLPFTETEETSRIQNNVDKVNQVLSRNWIDLELSNDQFEELQASLLNSDDDDHQPVDLGRKTLYRVFNDQEFKTGGRFYGGWWQNIPRRYRSKILINGKRTVEFDYSNMHPSILYAWAGQARPSDCYQNVLRPKHIPDYVSDRMIRSLTKAAFNAMLNAKRPLGSGLVLAS